MPCNASTSDLWCRGRPTYPSENRIRGFSATSADFTLSTWSQVVAPHQEAETTATTCAVGVFSWLSKDPIGISGGLNQYVAFAANPVHHVDPDGRAVQAAAALYVLGKGLVGGSLGAISGGLSGLFDSSDGDLSLENAGKGAVAGFAGGFVAGVASSLPIVGDVGGGMAGGWISATVYSKWQGIPLDSERARRAKTCGVLLGAGGGILDSFFEAPLFSPIATGIAGGGYNLADNLVQSVEDFVDDVIERREEQYIEFDQ